MGRLAVVLMAVLCFGMAGGVYYVAVQQPAQTVDNTATVEGTVVSTTIETTTSDTSTTYGPVVTYEYQYEGQTYTNDQIKLVGSVGFQSPGGAEEYLESYDAGDTVTVHVDSDDPSTSYLERGSAGLMIYGVIGFLGFIGLLSVVALVGDLLGVEAVDIK